MTFQSVGLVKFILWHHTHISLSLSLSLSPSLSLRVLYPVCCSIGVILAFAANSRVRLHMGPSLQQLTSNVAAIEQNLASIPQVSSFTSLLNILTENVIVERQCLGWPEFAVL